MRRLLFALLLVYTSLMPFERFWKVLTSGDSIFKPYRIVGLAILGLWLAWLAGTGRRVRLDFGDKCYLLLFAWGVVLALFWHAVEGNNLGYTGHAVQLILFGFAMYAFTKKMSLSAREIQLVLSAYVAGFSASVAWAFTMPEELTGRLRGLQNNPNQLGISAGISFMFLLGQFLFIDRPRTGWQILRVSTAIAMAALIGLSGSRGATFGTLAGSLLLLVLALRGSRGRKGSSRVTRVGAFAVLCAVAFATSFDRFDEAWEQTESRGRFDRDYTMQTAGERWDLWRSGWHVGMDHFGLGAGMMQYMSHHVESIKALADKSNDQLEDHVLGTHSDYVDLFACYGVVGLGAFFAYISWLGRVYWRQLNRIDPNAPGSYWRPLGASLLGGMLVYEISQNSFAWCDYWMVMALVHSVTHLPLASSSPARAAAQLAAKPGQVRPVQAKEAPALGRNQALVHHHGRS